MTKIFTAIRHLKAISQFAAQKDVRYYLNGVHVEATKKETRLVATDGHVMGLLNTGKQENEVGAYEHFIIPFAVIKALKAPTGNNNDAVEIELASEGYFMLRTLFADPVLFKPIGGVFPDYTRVMPQKTSGEAGQFNPELLAKQVKEKYFFPVVAHNGDNAALVDIGVTGFTGVVMPERSPAVQKESPAWALATLKPVEQKKAA